MRQTCDECGQQFNGSAIDRDETDLMRIEVGCNHYRIYSEQLQLCKRCFWFRAVRIVLTIIAVILMLHLFLEQ